MENVHEKRQKSGEGNISTVHEGDVGEKVNDAWMRRKREREREGQEGCASDKSEMKTRREENE